MPEKGRGRRGASPCAPAVEGTSSNDDGWGINTYETLPKLCRLWIATSGLLYFFDFLKKSSLAAEEVVAINTDVIIAGAYLLYKIGMWGSLLETRQGTSESRLFWEPRSMENLTNRTNMLTYGQ